MCACACVGVCVCACVCVCVDEHEDKPTAARERKRDGRKFLHSKAMQKMAGRKRGGSAVTPAMDKEQLPSRITTSRRQSDTSQQTVTSGCCWERETCQATGGSRYTTVIHSILSSQLCKNNGTRAFYT